MQLLDALAVTWPAAEIVRLWPWTLRRGDGGGRRVSAATLDGALADPGGAEATMRGWGQRPLFMIRPGEEALDVLLAGRGYAVEEPTMLFAGPAAALARERPDDAAVFGDAPLACMAEIWEAGGGGPARLAVMARAPRPRVFLLGRLGDRPAGCAFAAVSGGVAMLHALEVASFARRKGLGASMTRAVAAWARGAGAGTLALAVTHGNGPARALYGGLGMAPAGGYHYRIAEG